MIYWDFIFFKLVFNDVYLHPMIHLHYENLPHFCSVKSYHQSYLCQLNRLHFCLEGSNVLEMFYHYLAPVLH
jgi:hypothetical protein